MPGPNRRERRLKQTDDFDEIGGITLSGLADGDLLVYDQASGLWENTKSLTGDYDITGDLTLEALTASGAITAEDLTTTDDVTVGDALSVAGLTTLQGAVTAEDTLDVTGAVTLSDTLDVAGALTGAGFSFSGDGTIAGDLTVSGTANLTDLSLSGDLAVPGVLDVSGIALFRDDVSVLGTLSISGAFAASALGTPGDLSAGGNLTIAGTSEFSDDLTLKAATDEDRSLTILEAGANVGRLLWDASADALILETLQDSATITLQGSDAGSSAATMATFDPDGSVDLYYAGTIAALTTSLGLTLRDTSGGNPALSLQNNSSGELARIQHNTGTGLRLRSFEHGGLFRLEGEDAGGTNRLIFVGDPDGSVELYQGGSLAVATTSEGLTTTVAGGGNNGEVRITDADGETLSLFKVGGTGDALVRNNEDGGELELQATDSAGSVQSLFVGDPDGSANLYYDGSLAMDTFAEGIQIRDASGSSSPHIRWFSSGANVTDAWQNTSSGFLIDQRAHGGYVRLRSENNAGAMTDLLWADPDGSVDLYHDGAIAAMTASRGMVFRDPSVGATDISRIWADAAQNAYFQGLVNGQRVLITADDSGGTGHTLFDGDPDGSVDLYYDNAVVFSTAAEGVEVDGTGSSNIVLNYDVTGSPSDDAVIEVERGTSTNSALTWNETDDRWELDVAGETAWRATLNGSVDLYHDGVVALETRSGGVSVLATGGAGSNGIMTFEDGDGEDCFFRKRGDNGNFEIRLREHGSEIFVQAEDAGGTVRNIMRLGTASSASAIGFHGTAPVNVPAAYTPTNVSTDRSYDANSTSVAELADVLGTLIADLQSYGLLQ